MAKSESTKQSVIDEEFIATVYEQMLAFAMSQLQDRDKAQDVVQDAMVSALHYADKFKGQSTLKTWVFAILKNKIIDSFRKNNKYVALDELKLQSEEDNQSDDDFLQLLFDESGFWHKHAKPTAFDNSWLDPVMQVQDESFFKIMEACLTKLPAEQARVFLMKEYIELDTVEICETVGITTNKFYVVMHRARIRLQQCLQIRWFDAV